MVYFAASQIPIGSINPADLARLLALRKELEGKALIAEYDSPGDLASKVAKHLLARVRSMIDTGAIEAPPSRAEVARISAAEATRIARSASLD
jgi:hypothetical protein